MSATVRELRRTLPLFFGSRTRIRCFGGTRNSAVMLLLVPVMACAVLLCPSALQATQVPVRHTEGLVHGFLVLRTLEGTILADGDLTQVAHGNRVNSQLVFRFKDGSIYDETAIFSERRNFRLLSYHMIQKGPAFQHPIDISIDGLKGLVSVHYTDDGGQQKVVSDGFSPSPDLANGLVPILLKNVRADVPEITFSMVAATPKPRLVKLTIVGQGEDPFWIANSTRTARQYVVKVEIGGLTGLIAPLLGKQPPDTHIWILGGEAPTFVKAEGPLYLGGPIWRIELASPAWRP